MDKVLSATYSEMFQAKCIELSHLQMETEDQGRMNKVKPVVEKEIRDIDDL